MQTFSFRAKKNSGQVVSGRIKAKSKNDVLYMLAAKQLEPVHVEQQKNLMQLGSGGLSLLAPKHLVFFTRQLAFLVKAGIPIVQSLRIIQEITVSANLRAIVADIVGNIEKGNTFASALSAHPSVFNHMYVNIIEAGEVGGSLDIMLSHLAAYIEESHKLKSRVKKAMMYPGFVLSIGILIVIAIMVMVVPKFVGIFGNSGVELPLMTKILIYTSDFFTHNILFIIIGAFFIPFCCIMYLRSPAGRELKDQLLMFVPVLGPLVLKNSLARFSRTLSCLLSGGVNMAEALNISALTADNFFIEKSIQKVRDQVMKGQSVAQSLKKEKMIPALICNMVAIGEETGNMDATLEKVAEFYEEQVKSMASSISDLIQPFLIALLGSMVGFIVIALYLPIFKMPGVAGGM